MGYKYSAIPKGSKGLFQIVAHELSHTIASRMYDSNNRLLKQFTHDGYEKIADDWATYINDWK